MPFLVLTNQSKIKLASPSSGISWSDLKRYRENLEKRVHSVRITNGLDHTADLRAIPVSPTALKALVDGAGNGDYLVGHYYCEPKGNRYSNLNIALCIKKRRTAEADDEIVNNFVIDTQGKQITNYLTVFGHYKDRRQEILDSKKTDEFDADKEGRAHLIDINLRNTIYLLCEARDILYLYFILDEDGPGNKKNLSVVLVDREVVFENQSNGPIAYDHGTQCCPLS
jgi:hypothetical protein